MGVAQLGEPQIAELVARESRHRARRRVDSHDAVLRVGEEDGVRGEIEEGAEALLAASQGVFSRVPAGVGVDDVEREADVVGEGLEEFELRAIEAVGLLGIDREPADDLPTTAERHRGGRAVFTKGGLRASRPERRRFGVDVVDDERLPVREEARDE